MSGDSRGTSRKAEQDREFRETFSMLSNSNQLIVRAILLVWKRGRIFRPVEPIVLGQKKRGER